MPGKASRGPVSPGDSERERLLSQTRISFQEARKCPLILMGERTWLREMVEAFGREKEVEFYSSVETASIDTMISLCMKGLRSLPGISFHCSAQVVSLK